MAVGLAPFAAFAQDAPKRPLPRPQGEAEYTLQQLQRDGEAFTATLARIHDMADAGVQVNPKWLARLSAKGMHADVESLAAKGILNTPGNLPLISTLQVARVRALIEQNKADQALAAAKGFYNVASMKETEAAIKLVTECLDAKHADDPSVSVLFREQQIEWSGPEPEGFVALGTEANILRSIKVPESPFGPAAAALAGNDFATQVFRGNLWLLADRPSEARKAFEAAELVAAKPPETATAVEGIARSIRAASGALGPAQTFLAGVSKSP